VVALVVVSQEIPLVQHLVVAVLVQQPTMVQVAQALPIQVVVAAAERST
jgi:hypothetical protein